MIRPLRRAHLVLVTAVAGVTLTAVLLALANRQPSAVDDRVQPSLPGSVFAAAALAVDRDTLYLELSRAGVDSVVGRLTTSPGARWPDAVVYVSDGVAALTALPDGAHVLGTVGPLRALVRTIPAGATAIHLYSVAWDRPLGSWPLPTIIAPGPGQ